VVEKFCAAAWAAAGITLPTPFPRISYDDSMRQSLPSTLWSNHSMTSIMIGAMACPP